MGETNPLSHYFYFRDYFNMLKNTLKNNKSSCLIKFEMEIIMKNNVITNFVQVFNNELVVSHKTIAEQTKNKEENVSRLIRKYLEKLERFGAV